VARWSEGQPVRESFHASVGRFSRCLRDPASPIRAYNEMTTPVWGQIEHQDMAIKHLLADEPKEWVDYNRKVDEALLGGRSWYERANTSSP